MSLSSGKHKEQEINEVRCRVVESGISKERVEFLKELLEHNGYEVQVAEEPPKAVPPPKPAPPAPSTSEQSKPAPASVPGTSAGKPSPSAAEASMEAPEPEPEPEPTFVIGVTDIIFNAVVAVYNRALRTLDGKHVTADYWNQKTVKAEPNYWDRAKKEWL
jgi:outer membrane biosynthesis protein TonB